MNNFVKRHKEQKRMKKINRILEGLAALLFTFAVIMFYAVLYGGIIYIVLHFIFKYW